MMALAALPVSVLEALVMLAQEALLMPVLEAHAIQALEAMEDGVRAFVDNRKRLLRFSSYWANTPLGIFLVNGIQ